MRPAQKNNSTVVQKEALSDDHDDDGGPTPLLTPSWRGQLGHVGLECFTEGRAEDPCRDCDYHYLKQRIFDRMRVAENKGVMA